MYSIDPLRKLVKQSNDLRRVNINFKMVGLVLVYILSIFLNGLSEYVHSEFDIAYIGTSAWFWKVFRDVTNNLLILIATFLYLLDKAHKKDERIIHIKNEVEDTIQTEFNPITFEPFIDHFNHKRKIKRYKKLLATQLDILNTRMTPTDVHAWKEQDRNNKYVKQRLDIENALNDKYIEENIDYIPVRYNVVTTTFIKSGYRKKVKKHEDDDPYAVESGTWKFTKDIGPKILLTIAYTLAMRSVALEVLSDVDWKLATIAIILSLLPIAMQIYIANVYRDQYIAEKILRDFGIRNDVLIQYLDYKNNSTHKEVVVNGVRSDQSIRTTNELRGSPDPGISGVYESRDIQTT